MWRYVLVLALVCACGGGDEDNAPVEAPEVAEDLTPVAPAEPARSPLDKARDLAVAGDMAGALAAARALIAADAGNAGAWRLFRYAALNGDAATAAKDLPEGGSPFLKAELLLAGGDAAGAMTAAKGLLASNPNGAAALMARAAMAGADAGVLEPGPAASLVGFAAAKDAKGARKNAEAAKAVGGWRAAMLRGDVARARGQWAMAYKEYGTVAKADKISAKYAGNAARVALATSAGKPAAKGQKPAPGRSAAQLARWTQKALDLAVAEGWSKDLLRDAKAAVRSQIQVGASAAALAAAQSAHGRVASDHGSAPDLSLLVARAAIAAGNPVLAADSAKAARTAFEAAKRPKGATRASWRAGQAAYALGRVDELQAAVDQLEGPRKEVLKALSALLKGQMKTATSLFPAQGLKPADAAYAYLLAARTRPGVAVTWLDRAIAASDAAGALGPRIQTRLAKESLIRSRNAKGAAALRAEIARIAPDGAGLKAELGARGLLAGMPSGFPGGDGLPPVMGTWKALAAKGKPPKTDIEADKGLTQWARGRAAAATGSLEGHDAHFQKALGKLPLHRMAELGTVTVLDGSEGVDVDTDLQLLSAMKSESAVGMALMAHDVGHRMESMARDRSLGRRPAASLDPTTREPLLAASAAVRSAVLDWMAGSGAWPADGFTKLAAAEKAASANHAFASAMPAEGSSVRELLSALGTGAVLSLRVSRGNLHSVGFSRSNRSIKDLGPVKPIRQLAKAHFAAMSQAAVMKAKTAHGSGDQMRKLVLDPLHGDMTGVGKYVVVGPPDLTGFPYNTFPEQAEGLRWLAEIRKMTVAPTIASLTRKLVAKDQNTYTLDYLAFGSDGQTNNEALLSEHETPNEIKTCSRHFSSGHDEALTGDSVTLAAWREKAGHSRYIHIAGLEAGAGGGFKFADGSLSLDEIRNTPLNAQLVVITARTAQPQQLHRARAFLDAGAEWVLVAVWDIPDRARVNYLSSIYDSMNQERPPARAVAEGRRTLLKDALMGDDNDDPSLWGGLLLFGKP